MGNFLADVGRSQAIPQFLETARLARKDEAGIASENERINLLKQESGRADTRLGIDVETARIAKIQNDEKIKQIEEGNKTLPWSHVSEMFPSKGVADFATQYFKSKGQLNEDGPEPGVLSRHLDELTQKINPKSDKYDISIATQVNGVHLNSVMQKKAYIEKAMNDPEAFKAFKQQNPEVKKPEDLKEMLDMANQEYGQAFNSYHQITEKDKIMRQEATDKQAEMKDYHQQLIQIAKDNAESNKLRAGADVTRAGKAGGIADINSITPVAPGEKNDLALQGLSSGEAAIVKQLSEYKIPLPSGMALRTPYWQGILQRTALYDNAFDATQYNVRMGVKKDFTAGSAAKNIRSLNTAVGHLETLSKAAKELDNAPVQVWNYIANKGITATGDPSVTKFNAAATAVEGELANVFKNTGATDQEIKAWRDNLSTSFSKEQLSGSINTVIDLLGGRLGALRNQYETGLGKPKDFRFLSDKSLNILKSLKVDINSIDPVSTKQAGNNQIAQSEKTVVKQFTSPSTGKTKLIYSDGTEEIK